MKKTILTALVVASCTFASQAFAAGLVPCGGPGEKACDLCFLFFMIKNVVDFFLFTIIPLVAILIFIIGGFNLMANRGNAEATSKTKKMLFATVAGLVLVFGGWALVNTVFTALGVTAWQSSEGKWWKFDLVCQTPVVENTNPGGEKDIEVCPDGLTDN